MQKRILSALASMALMSVCGVTFAAPPVHLDRKGERWAASTLRRMSLEEKVGQMIMPWARIEFMNVKDPQYVRLREEMQKYHVGGFGVTVFADGASLAKSEPLEAAALTNGLQRDSKYPLIFAADFERGLAMRLNGATGFPAAMAFGATGDPKLAEQFGSITAREARAIGVQWNWFPDADVNSNPANPIINTRSFGEDPVRVGQFVAAYIRGAHSEGMLTTVKHFPGHGDTDTDTHLALARSNASMERLNALELVPFRAGIAAGVDSVMTAHILVPALEPDPNKPASVSHNVITNLLKNKLEFRGLVITDALDMAGLMKAFNGTPAEISAQEAVAAIEAGSDMVIIPADLDGAYNGLLQAVKNGRISQARIDASVLKILRAKASVGLDRARLVDTAAVEKEIAQPQSVAFAQAVADRATTLVEDTDHLVPMTAARETAPGALVSVLFVDDARLSEGVRVFLRQLRTRVPQAAVFTVDPANAGFIGPEVLAAVAKADRVIAVAEAVPSARRVTPGQGSGSAGLALDASQLLAEIVKAAPEKTIVAAFGNPYTGMGVTGIRSYLCTFSNTEVSADSLVRALFGEMPIRGRLPVSLPGMAERGAGLDR